MYRLSRNETKDRKTNREKSYLAIFHFSFWLFFRRNRSIDEHRRGAGEGKALTPSGNFFKQKCSKTYNIGNPQTKVHPPPLPWILNLFASMNRVWKCVLIIGLIQDTFKRNMRKSNNIESNIWLLVVDLSQIS